VPILLKRFRGGFDWRNFKLNVDWAIWAPKLQIKHRARLRVEVLGLHSACNVLSTADYNDILRRYTCCWLLGRWEMMVFHVLFSFLSSVVALRLESKSIATGVRTVQYTFNVSGAHRFVYCTCCTNSRSLWRTLRSTCLLATLLQPHYTASNGLESRG
jgi:hypothetical protein